MAHTLRLLNSGVYFIIAPSGNIYIGSTNNFMLRKKQHFERLRNNRHENSTLQKAWLKYGDQLMFCPVERCEVPQLIEREQWWIDNHHLVCTAIYNASRIADRVEFTDEVRAKMRVSAKTRKPKTIPPHVRLKMSEAAKRRAPPKTGPEISAKVSAALKGRKKPPRTAEHAAKISAALTGRKPTARQLECLAQGRRTQALDTNRPDQLGTSRFREAVRMV